MNILKNTSKWNYLINKIDFNISNLDECINKDDVEKLSKHDIDEILNSLKKTSVVNVKVKFIRPNYENLKDWSSDQKNIYIGRKGIVFVEGERFPKKDSIWANPFKEGRDGTLDEILEKYEIYIRDKIKKENLKNELLKLKGKNLGCWCKPNKCHGDILLKLIKEFEN